MLYKIIAVNKDGSTYKHEEIVESDSEYSALQNMLYQNKLYHNLDLSNCELTATPVTIKSITFVDNSEYDPDKCRNGGAYSFSCKYIREKSNSDKWIRKYGTSTDFAYCERCGTFNHSTYECDNDEYIITTDELLYKMVNYKEDDEHFVNISYCEC